MIHYDLIEQTPIGAVCVAANENGLCAVVIAASHHARRLRAMFPGETVVRVADRVALYRCEMEAYFGGSLRKFTQPIDKTVLKAGFQRRVLEHLSKLPFGQVITYGDLAAAAGSPGAARAVGAAVAANPVPIVIPCHRVVSSNGIGGFSGGGVANKRALLTLEGAIHPELF